jgi:hypothetical protein
VKYLVLCGNTYSQEVDAETFTEACAAAFAIRLPLAIGELVAAKVSNPKKKTGWDTASYMHTAGLLRLIGMRDLYLPLKRGFVLNTKSPLIEPIEDLKI